MKHVLVPLVVGCALLAPVAAPAAPEIKAPEFRLKDLKGKTIKLSQFKGKVVLLNFWATWCGPCREEIPDLVRVYDAFKKQGLVVLGISLDDEPTEVVGPFMADIKKAAGVHISYPMLVGDESVSDAYGGIRGIPTSFLIDRKGIIRRKFIGPPGNNNKEVEQAFSEAVTKLL